MQQTESRRRTVELKGTCRPAFALLVLTAVGGARAALAGPARAAAPSSGLRVDGARPCSLGWRAANESFTARVSCVLPRGRHTCAVTAENLIARSSSGTASFLVR